MGNEKRREGWLLIDNHLAPGPDGTRFMEAATITCSHCQRQLIRSTERTREREWCWNCDRYICDPCAAVRAVAGCKTFKQLMDENDKMILRNERA